MNELVKALRCSCEPMTKDKSCVGCKYRGLDEIDENFPTHPDVVIDGVGYWEYCDTERMALDSADLIEQLTK